MPRSLTNGDYSLIMAVESASRANSWYRVLADRRTGALSCDCPAWTFRQDNTMARACKHTRLATVLASDQRSSVPTSRASGAAAVANVLVQAVQQQWPGLGGRWSIEQRSAAIDEIAYQFVLLRLTTGNGTIATGLVAFTQRHHPTQESMLAGVAGWAGYALAAELARVAGYALAGQPPAHYSSVRRTTGGAGTRAQGIGLSDILRVGDRVHLGDGYTPMQRAENTLRLFLGETLYAQLERQHFLDVSSVRYAHAQRVYRIRRDPDKRRDRRVRVFEHNRYVNDFCIVRGQDVPEADHWLTVFLRLISDEEGLLSVVKHHNVFSPHSDDYYEHEEETLPAVWQPNVA